MVSKPPAFNLRRLVLPVFVPSLLLSVGEGALIPIVPAAAERLGADLPTAGILAGLFMLGTLLADLPAAHLVNRLGERKTMIITALLAAAGISLAYLSDTMVALGAANLIAGASQAVFGLARHGFMAHNVPQTHRARGLALLGGMFRGGSFLGPALAALIIWLVDVRTVFLVAVLFCLLAASVLAVIGPTGFEDDRPEPSIGILGVAKAERHKLATLGVASAILATVRTTRQIGLPLWALAINLEPATTALFIAVGGAVDFALFYVSGQVMDRFGRRAAAVPTLILTGIVHLFVFLAVDAIGFLWLSIGMALANGIGSGVIMVIGADLAPPKTRNQFLASFRLIIDAAQAATPPILAVGAAAVGLAGSMTGFGLLAFGGAWLMHRYIPRFGRH